MTCWAPPLGEVVQDLVERLFWLFTKKIWWKIIFPWKARLWFIIRRIASKNRWDEAEFEECFCLKSNKHILIFKEKYSFFLGFFYIHNFHTCFCSFSTFTSLFHIDGDEDRARLLHQPFPPVPSYPVSLLCLVLLWRASKANFPPWGQGFHFDLSEHEHT